MSDPFDQVLHNFRQRQAALGELPMSATPVDFFSHRGESVSHAELIAKGMRDLAEAIVLRDQRFLKLEKLCADMQSRLESIETTL